MGKTGNMTERPFNTPEQCLDWISHNCVNCMRWVGFEDIVEPCKIKLYISSPRYLMFPDIPYEIAKEMGYYENKKTNPLIWDCPQILPRKR
jgi:hypothetical protein